MKQAAYDLCYLAACAVNGITPEKEKSEAMNLENLYKMSKAHSLSALAAMTISSAFKRKKQIQNEIDIVNKM